MCLSALKFLVKALKGEVTCESDEMRERVESDGRKTGGNDSAIDETNTVRNSKSKDTVLSKKMREAPLKLEDLLPIFMPDRTGVLSSSFSLTVDDAPWISSALNQRNSTVKFVHSKIDPLDALLLGARSLRGLLFSGDDIMCPNPGHLKALLLNDQVNEVIRDMVALSDTLSATAVHILLDQRTHPVESLMHPGLAVAQGPALVIFIEGPALTSEAICQLLVPPETLPPSYDDEKKSNGYGFSSTGFEVPLGLSAFNGNGGSVKVDEGYLQREEKLYPRTGGKRICTAFAITDCLQIVTGREYIIFDPCGYHLLSEEMNDGDRDKGNTKMGTKTLSNTPPRAQRCYLSGSHKSSVRAAGEEDVLTRFPDQFSPLLSLPFNLDKSLSSLGKLNGILIRMVRHLF